jgi:ATP-binding cassette subfamily F protein 3
MRYTITNGTVSAGGQTILSHIDFEIKGTEKIAIVGRNGAGKTTLLRLIAGELTLDRDDRRQTPGIQTDRKLTVGMLHQSSVGDREKTVEELLLEGCPERDTFSRERYLYEMEYDRLFTGFGFQKTEKKRKLSSFSGGEQTKISLIRLLLEKPDILLLDEPTNHLDISTVEWLENYMRGYERAVVFVSHDRFFLDRVVGAVYELQDGKLKRYAGNYTAYRKQKRKDIELQKKAYVRQQEEIARLNELIAQFKNKAKKAAFARSRKTILERMEKIECPREDDAHMFTGTIEPLAAGSKWVLEAEHLKIGYDKVLLELSLRVRRGQKIGIIGENGSGKSTFLKTVAGLVEPLGGEAALGNNIWFGYFDQQSADISSEKSVLEHFHSLFPGMTEKEVRQTLGAYLFRGKDAAKRVSDLSGGEKSRLILAELLCSRPNLLLLDEPTNHMDIPAKETLESAFSAYSGTILFVSHDRYFIEQVADAILVFGGQHVMYYPFGYAHYIEHTGTGGGEDLSAMVRAENQALVADLKAVPRAERHRLKEINTEEAYADWRLRLAAEPLFAARDRYEAACAGWQDIPDAWVAEFSAEDEEFAQTREKLEQAEAAWTQACLDWYELFLSLVS